jgi:hypothetical protein
MGHLLQMVLLLGGQLVPDGEKFSQFHAITPCFQYTPFLPEVNR